MSNILTRMFMSGCLISIFLFFDQSLATVLALHVFLFQFNISKPYPAASGDPREFLQAGPSFKSKNATHHDAKYEVNNSSNLLPSQFEQTHVRRARHALGCLKSESVQQCGNDLIVTVQCKTRSKTCIKYGHAAPRCVTEKSYFPACGKVFNTNCLCQGQSG